MYSDVYGHSPKWWQWALSGTELAVGVVLCATGVGTGVGVSLIVAGTTSMISNVMDACGVDGTTASIVSNSLDIIGGVALCFTPFASIGSRMIGPGVGGFAGGLIYF